MMVQQINLKYIVLYSCLLLFVLESCNSEKKPMIKAIAGDYVVDTTLGDYNIMGKSLYSNLKLKLLEDSNYNFTPVSKLLKGYDGKWDISNDGEFSYFIFECKDGTYQSNRTMSIGIVNNNHTYMIYFTKIKR